MNPTESELKCFFSLFFPGGNNLGIDYQMAVEEKTMKSQSLWTGLTNRMKLRIVISYYLFEIEVACFGRTILC